MSTVAASWLLPWKDKRFLLRVLVALVLVPPSGPFLFGRLLVPDIPGPIEWSLIVSMATNASIVSFAVMLFAGLPALALCLRRGWMEYRHFIVGGAVAFSLVNPLFIPMGALEGALLRLILFGAGRWRFTPPGLPTPPTVE